MTRFLNSEALSFSPCDVSGRASLSQAKNMWKRQNREQEQREESCCSMREMNSALMTDSPLPAVRPWLSQCGALDT